MPWKAKPCLQAMVAARMIKNSPEMQVKKKLCTLSQIVCSYLYRVCVKKKARKSLKISRKQLDPEVEKKLFYFWR